MSGRWMNHCGAVHRIQLSRRTELRGKRRGSNSPKGRGRGSDRRPIISRFYIGFQASTGLWPTYRPRSPLLHIDRLRHHSKLARAGYEFASIGFVAFRFGLELDYGLTSFSPILSTATVGLPLVHSATRFCPRRMSTVTSTTLSLRQLPQHHSPPLEGYRLNIRLSESRYTSRRTCRAVISACHHWVEATP